MKAHLERDNETVLCGKRRTGIETLCGPPRAGILSVICRRCLAEWACQEIRKRDGRGSQAKRFSTQRPL